jgi:dTDP-4-dehydrorhamnose reductase
MLRAMTDPSARYVLIGATGQLGSDLVRTFDRRGTLIPLTHQQIDILDAAQTEASLAALRPTHVINTAAWNLVDRAEDESRAAFALNGDAVGTLAAACDRLGATLVHFSTDYVFDGAKRAPYVEADPPNPLSAYGESKLAGERLARERCARAMVVRVAALFGIARSSGKGGSNFVETMLRAAAAGRQLRVVADQITTPSYTVDVARSVWRLIAAAAPGIYHVSGGGQTTWYEFAREIFQREGLTPALTAVSATEFGARAKRPPYSVLAHGALHSLGHPEPPSWADGLTAYLAERRELSATARRDS